MLYFAPIELIPNNSIEFLVVDKNYGMERNPNMFLGEADGQSVGTGGADLIRLRKLLAVVNVEWLIKVLSHT